MNFYEMTAQEQVGVLFKKPFNKITRGDLQKVDLDWNASGVWGVSSDRKLCDASKGPEACAAAILKALRVRSGSYIAEQDRQEKTFRNPAGGLRIVHNRLLGGWYIVRGPHQTPLGGRFDSRAEAQAHLSGQAAARDARAPRRNPKRKPSDYSQWMRAMGSFSGKQSAKQWGASMAALPVKRKPKKKSAHHSRIAVQSRPAQGYADWVTLHLFPNTAAGKKDAQKYGASLKSLHVDIRALVI